MNKLKQEADVMINIPDDKAASNVIRIEGNKEGVKKAKVVSFGIFCLFLVHFSLVKLVWSISSIF